MKLKENTHNSAQLLTDIKITIVDGVNKGKKYRIAGRKARIGRGPNNDIVILNSKISKEHAVIEIHSNRIEIKDLNSSNGIYINNQKTKQGYLSPGDKVSLGSVCDFIISGSFESYDSPPPLKEETIGDFVNELKQTKASSKIIPLNKDFEIPEEIVAPSKNYFKLLILVAIILFGAYFVFMPSKNINLENSVTKSKTVITQLPSVMPKDFKPALESRIDFANPADLQFLQSSSETDIIFKKAYNTYLSNRFVDAINLFDEVLVFDKKHELAKLYKIRAEMELNELIDIHDKNGRILFSTLRYQQAIIEFRHVMNLLSQNPSDVRYAEAKKFIKQAETKLKRF